MSLVRLAGQRTWLIGTRRPADRLRRFRRLRSIAGRLAIIQPLLVTTVVPALPLGVRVDETSTSVAAEMGGAAVILLGLGLFAVFGDRAGGKENAPGGDEWAVAIASSVRSAPRCWFSGRHGTLEDEGGRLRQRGHGILFGLSASDEAHARVPPRGPRRDVVALAVRTVLALAGCSVRPPAGVSRHRAAWLRRSRPSRWRTRS